MALFRRFPLPPDRYATQIKIRLSGSYGYEQAKFVPPRFFKELPMIERLAAAKL
jgi:hypothetical protein